jgi:hypothetical protein
MSETEKNKELLVEQLKRTPIIETACQKINVGRSTYYYWRLSDPEFAHAADQALKDGTLLVNDLAEATLISLIKERNLGATLFWLRSRHPDYKQKLFDSAIAFAQGDNNELYFELFGKLKPENEQLLETTTDPVKKIG